MINGVIKQYKANLEHEEAPNSSLIWEVLKMEIRKNTIKYSSKKKRERIAEQNEIENEIYLLENKESLTEDGHIKLQCNKDKLKDLYDNKVRGAMIRCKTQYYEQVTKEIYTYFLPNASHNTLSIKTEL